MKADYMLENPEWKYDKVPEFYDGKNVYDFVDPDIEAKLQALEEEEEKLEEEGFYESEEEIDDDEEADVMRKAELIREKQQLIRNEARMKKRLKNQAIIPRKLMKKPLSEFEDALDQLGVDTTDIADRARSQSRGRARSRSRVGTEDPDAMDVDGRTPRERVRSLSRPASRAPTTSRRDDGIVDDANRTKAERIAKLNQKRMNRMARQGEGDRHTTASITKHLVVGKRGMGKTNRR
jgi:nucleolar GTP-binding protein